MSTRPPLRATYSRNQTTLYVEAPACARPADAYVYCQLRKRACRRDGVAHAVHTATFNAYRAVRQLLCLPPPPGQMQFPPSRQGRTYPSPRLEAPPPLD